MRSDDSPSRHAMLSRDTDRATERLQISLWARMSPTEKLGAASNASVAALDLCLAGARSRAGDAADESTFHAVAALKLGRDLARHAYDPDGRTHRMEATSMDPLEVALAVAEVLTRCGLRYVIGGSVASSIAGEPRSTLDVDMMVDIPESSLGCVITGLGTDFYADPDAFVRAIRARASVNVIHLPTATKIDLFVMGATSIEAGQMARRRKVAVPGRPGAELFVYTPEDILLQKLRWYALGGQASDRQWRDILGIVAVQGEALDVAYLRTAAAAIDVSGILDRAIAEAGRQQL